MAEATPFRTIHLNSIAALCAALLAGPVAAQDIDPVEASEPAAARGDPAVLDAERMPMAVRSLVLDGYAHESGLVAVGERGHALLSADGGEWTQADSMPTRSTLTAVTGAGGSLWAVGHDGVIVHSGDAGRTWERQREAPWVEGSFEPDAGVPLLDVLFLDGQRGMAIGAFSLLLETTDGGSSWTSSFLSEVAVDAGGAGGSADAGDAEAPPVDDGGIDDDGFGEDDGLDDDWGFSADDLALDAEDDPHLNAIARAGGGGLLIAGERGSVFRSRDEGGTWERLALPYEGSMFGALAWEDDHVMVFGLRGNVFESFDLGDSWQRVDSGTSVSLMGGAALPGGGAVLVGNEGRLLHRSASGEPFRLSTHVNADGETPVLATVLAGADGGFILLGERGIDRADPVEQLD